MKSDQSKSKKLTLFFWSVETVEVTPSTMGTCPIILHTPRTTALKDIEDGLGQCVQFAKGRARDLLSKGVFTPSDCRLMLLHLPPSSKANSLAVCTRGIVFHMAVITRENGGTWYYEASSGEGLGHIKCLLKWKLALQPPRFMQILTPHLENMRGQALQMYMRSQGIRLPDGHTLRDYKSAVRVSCPDVTEEYCFKEELNYVFSKQKEMPYVIETYHSANPLQNKTRPTPERASLVSWCATVLDMSRRTR